MNVFEQITKSPEVLGEFLRGLPVIEAPWDREFQERFCADCLYLNCDGCPHEEYRNNPLWWLTLEAEERAAERARRFSGFPISI